VNLISKTRLLKAVCSCCDDVKLHKGDLVADENVSGQKVVHDDREELRLEGALLRVRRVLRLSVDQLKRSRGPML
jgi:hypothetical protein